ncbi:hypothetical protein ASE25_05170 [Terrabacter sp. Root85]|uniref:hypothetical protein n=1 Tax=Terrabacter sp. Root85 TaxID=1736603 RepID=UPI0006FF90B7|nr:hypothetical protein [Terrabacter sp. Root85]KRC92702.1 hypothetical protein ASE25_05170 [Terrabacter sp. Root85]
MNLTDLRDELTTHADDLGTAPDFTAGVAGRVRTTKRRRAVAAGSVATLAVAALAVGVVTSLGRPAPTVPAGPPSSAAPMIGADGMPFRSVPDAPGDVVKDGLRYRARVGDDTLVAGFIGDRGQGQFSLVWEPTTTHVSIGAECYLPGLTDAEAATYMVTVSFGGTAGFFGSSCAAGRPAERDFPAGGTVPGEPGQGWTELTVGRTASVRIQLVDAKTRKPASVDGAQLTGAIYAQGARALIRDLSGTPVAALPDVIEREGYRYRLTASIAGPIDVAGTPLETAAPQSGPFLVTSGTVVTGSPRREPAYFQLEGLVGEQTQWMEGGSQTAPQPSGDGRPLQLVVAEGSAPPHGTGFIAIYTPEP